MYANRDFSPFDAVEMDDFSFNFAKRMKADETLISAEWFCTVAEDSEQTDDYPENHLDGPAETSGTITTQSIMGLAPGVRYVLQAVVETSLGKTLSLWAHTECEAPQ